MRSFLPGKGVIEVVIADDGTMQVPLVERRLGEASIVVGHEYRQERIASRHSVVTFCARPNISFTVSGVWDIAAGSIIVPSHVNCRASSAHTETLAVKPTAIGTNMLARNIDAPLVICRCAIGIAFDGPGGRL